MFDKSFCANKECTQKDNCDRFEDRIKEYRKKYPKKWIKPWLSFANFNYLKDKSCFIKKETT